MSKATYWQRGETLDYKNSGASAIEANTIMVLGKRIGVAGTDIKPGELGSVHVRGVFEFPKTASQAVGLGAEVYYDPSTKKITTAAPGSGSSSVKAGYAADAADADAETVLVNINA